MSASGRLLLSGRRPMQGCGMCIVRRRVVAVLVLCAVMQLAGSACALPEPSTNAVTTCAPRVNRLSAYPLAL